MTENNEFCFIQITDTHIDANKKIKHDCNMEDILNIAVDDIAKNYPNCLFIIHTGDIAHNGEIKEYEKFKSIISKLNIEFYYIRGTHDCSFSDFQPILHQNFELASKKHWSFEKNNWHFIGLNAGVTKNKSAHKLDKDDMMWLEDKLNQNASINTIIFIHPHTVPVGSRWLDELILENYKSFNKLVSQKSCVKGIVHGHIHQNAISVCNGVKYIGTPSLSWQFAAMKSNITYENTEPGYRVFKIDNNKLISFTRRLSKLPICENLTVFYD